MKKKKKSCNKNGLNTSPESINVSKSVEDKKQTKHLRNVWKEEMKVAAV